MIFQNFEQQNKTNDILVYVESKMWQECTYQQNKNRLTDMENRLVVAKGGGRVGWTGSLGLDENYYI